MYLISIAFLLVEWHHLIYLVYMLVTKHTCNSWIKDREEVAKHWIEEIPWINSLYMDIIVVVSKIPPFVGIYWHHNGNQWVT